MAKHRTRSLILAVVALLGCREAKAPAAPGGQDLLVFNAAALGPPFRQLGESLEVGHTIRAMLQENAPSLEAVRKLTELGRVPDILATADVTLFDRLVVPKFSDWYVVFGTNALVLGYGPHSIGHEALTAESWWHVLLRPRVRTGRSDPSIDPSGYRTLMALQLAERHYQQPGLAARLLAAMPETYVRHAEADLSALLQAGELDYIWTYRNLALAHRLTFFELPPEVNLADPAKGDWYANATARIRAGGDTITLRGAPIEFALLVPRTPPHPDPAREFVELLLSPRGAAVLRATGFEPLGKARIVGSPPPEWQTVIRNQ